MGGVASAEPAILACTIRNQTAVTLEVRTYSLSSKPLAAAAKRTTEGAPPPPFHAKFTVPRYGQAPVEAPPSEGGKGFLVAVRLPPPATPAPSARGTGRGGAARALRDGNGLAHGTGSAALVQVSSGAEVYVNADRTGALVLRTFCKEATAPTAGTEGDGGAWTVLPSRDATPLFDESAPSSAAVSKAPAVLQQPQAKAKSSAPKVATRPRTDLGPSEKLERCEDDDEEDGLYLTEGQIQANQGRSSTDCREADAVDGDSCDEPEIVEAAPTLPPECVCPISHELFADPVLAADGFTYERRCIEAWLRKHAATSSAGKAELTKSPMTGRPLETARLIPNLAVRSLCQDYRARWGEGPGSQSSFTNANDGQSSPSSSRKAGDIHAGAFESLVPALVEMFGHLPAIQIRRVCADLSATGVEDVDVVVRRLLQCSEEEQGAPEGENDSPQRRASVAGLPLTAVSIETAPMNEESMQKPAADASTQEAPAASEFAVEDIPPGFDDVYRELVSTLGFTPVAARKAIMAGRAESLEEAVIWLEKHQTDKDLDTPEEELEERERLWLYLAVMRVSTIQKPTDRVECYIMLHKILGRIMEDPENARFRKIRSKNPLFRRRIGCFPPAMSLLRLAGFRIGDFWTSHQDREPCVEFSLPVDSDNPASVRFVRIFSILDEIVTNPDAWLGLFLKASDAPPPAPSLAARLAGPREHLAELHEWRMRDPRGFEHAMREQGKRGNAVVYNITQRTEPEAPRFAEGQDRYRTLRERYGGQREFNLQDIEQMRYDDAIRGATLYAQEYVEQQQERATASGSDTYSALRSRYYDAQYMGRLCVDRTNAFRAQQRLPPLQWNQAIADIAEEHARQMARGEMPFSHLDFDKRVARYPFVHLGAGENLAYNGGHMDAAVQAVQQWINSPGHRRNLLGTWNLCGVGVAQVGSMFYFTQLFARTPGPLC